MTSSLPVTLNRCLLLLRPLPESCPAMLGRRDGRQDGADTHARAAERDVIQQSRREITEVARDWAETSVHD